MYNALLKYILIFLYKIVYKDFIFDLGLGHQGELVSVRPTYAYDQLLLPKLAIYASPDNLERMKNNLYQAKDEEKPSSIHALQVLLMLSYFINLKIT